MRRTRRILRSFIAVPLVNFVFARITYADSQTCQTSFVRVKSDRRERSALAFSDPPSFSGHGRRRRGRVADAARRAARRRGQARRRLPSAADVPAAARPACQSPDVEALLAQMTLDEKIGQMTQADMKALKDGTEVRDFLLGSVLSGADSLPKPNEPATWVEMYDRFQSQALATRLGIPMLYGVDAVHGHGEVKGATIFPHNIGLGCTRDPGARRGGGARHRARGRGHRHRLDLRALHRRRARRALGPHLRELRRDARAGREPGRRRHPRLRAGDRRHRRSSPPPSTSWATAARWAARTRATRASPRRSCAASTCPATSPPSRPASAP